MTPAREFLDLYCELEEALNVKYKKNPGRYSSVVVRYASEEGKRFREDLDLCREMRNMLSHHSAFDGDEIFAPSPKLNGFLRKVIAEVKDPPVAGNICTAAKSLFKCSGTTSVIWLIREMNKYGYSHIPIVKGGVLVGVFSSGTVLNAIGDGSVASVTDSTRVSEFEAYLPPDRHTNEAYGFVHPKTMYCDLVDVFSPSGPHSPRVAAIFVTSNGKADGKLVGMITPWDVIRERGE